MKDKIEKALKNRVDPVLAKHFGGAALTGFEDGVAKVKLTGACATCPSAQDTISSIVKEAVMEECPEVKDVILDTSVSEELLEVARQILNKSR